MAIRGVSMAEGYRLIQRRLASRSWWVIPMATMPAAEIARNIQQHFYTGGNAVLFDVVVVPQPTPDVPLLNLALAAKVGMTAQQLGELFGLPTPNENQDLLVHPSTPLSVLCWLDRLHRQGDSRK